MHFMRIRGTFRYRCLGVRIAIAAASVIAGSAQSTGRIEGALFDVQGGAIVGAKVIATDEAKQVVARETTTGQGGAFQLQPLLPGSYSVKIEAKGFKTLNRTNLLLDPNQIMNLGNLTMDVGETRETVNVSAEAPTVTALTACNNVGVHSTGVEKVRTATT